MELVEHVYQIALRRFDEGGYENTSLKDISAEAGISLRTLFRHFKSKDSILSWGSKVRERQINERLTERPIDERLVESYLYAVQPMLNDLVNDTNNALRDLRLVEEVPTLRTQYLMPSIQHQTDAMDHEYARRLGCSSSDGRMRLLRRTLFSAVVEATNIWSHDGRQGDLHALVASYVMLLDVLVERIKTSMQGTAILE